MKRELLYSVCVTGFRGDKQVKGSLCASLKSLFDKLFARFQWVASCIVAYRGLFLPQSILIRRNEKKRLLVYQWGGRRDFNLLPIQISLGS